MISRKTAATISLGLIIFGFIFEKENKIPQHEPIRTQVTFPYTLNSMSVSGTASATSGPITFTKI